MKICCPKNETHNEFVVAVKVAQDWKVDEDGNFLDCTNECTEVYKYPSSDDFYICWTCGAVAIAR